MRVQVDIFIHPTMRSVSYRRASPTHPLLFLLSFCTLLVLQHMQSLNGTVTYLLETLRAYWVKLTHERLQLLFISLKSAFSGTKIFWHIIKLFKRKYNHYKYQNEFCIIENRWNLKKLWFKNIHNFFIL